MFDQQRFIKNVDLTSKVRPNSKICSVAAVIVPSTNTNTTKSCKKNVLVYRQTDRQTFGPLDFVKK